MPTNGMKGVSSSSIFKEDKTECVPLEYAITEVVWTMVIVRGNERLAELLMAPPDGDVRGG